MPRILELLGESELQEKIHIFAVEDQARMKALTGRELIGQAMADQNAICCVFSKTTRAVGAHEVMHIVSFRQWGGSKSGRVWLAEGLAVFADDHWQGHGLHALCHYLRDSGDLAPLGRLMQEMTSYPYLVSYPECGSFVKFLYERYGRDKVKQLWRAPRVDKVEPIFGKDLPGLAAEWLGVIDGADAASIRSYDVKPQLTPGDSPWRTDATSAFDASGRAPTRGAMTAHPTNRNSAWHSLRWKPISADVMPSLLVGTVGALTADVD